MKRTGLAVFLLSLLLAPAALAQDDTRELMRGTVEALAEGADVDIGGAEIAAALLIQRLYERREFEPAWVGSRNADELIEMIERVGEEGLDPDNYHAEELVRLRSELQQRDSPELRVVFDLVLTDSLARLGVHLRFGKVNPHALDPSWNFTRRFGDRDPVETVQEAIDSPSIRAFLDELIPRGPIYKRLRELLAEYREFQAQGGWPTVPAGPTLKPGMRDPRVGILRERLARENYTTTEPGSDPDLLDPLLEQEVREFQSTHQLDVDGAVGPATLDALNVPVGARIDQLRINLERARWIMRDIPDDFIVVNIAGFKVRLVRDHAVVWTTRAVVGKPYRETPVFEADLKYIVFNPTWTVPPGILSKDILPKLKQDPGYLKQKNMAVIDRDGRVVDPASLDFSSYTARNFPYQIRQEPGPTNVLGRVKFIFPNPHFVFLHDTPSRSLFDRTTRTFSSGCIRTENPLVLAELLLDDPQKWNQETIGRVLDAAAPKTVFLPEPLPVLILYWTVSVVDPKAPTFFPDVYGRDPAVLAALGADFEFRVPAELKAKLEGE